MDIGDSSTENKRCSKLKQEDAISDTTYSTSLVLEDDNTEIHFDDVPLGMGSFPSVSLSHSVILSQLSLSENPFGNSPFPSYRVDEILQNTNSLDASAFSVNCFASLNSCSSYEPFSTSRPITNMNESSSTNKNPSISFANYSIECGPLPQGFIRNNPQIVGTTNNRIVSKLNYDFPILPCNTTSLFDPSFVPESFDGESDSIDSSEFDSYFSDHHSNHNSSKKNNSHKNTKKWSCSDCRYLNSMSNPHSFTLRNRDKELFKLWETISLFHTQKDECCSPEKEINNTKRRFRCNLIIYTNTDI